MTNGAKVAEFDTPKSVLISEIAIVSTESLPIFSYKCIKYLLKAVVNKLFKVHFIKTSNSTKYGDSECTDTWQDRCLFISRNWSSGESRTCAVVMVKRLIYACFGFLTWLLTFFCPSTLSHSLPSFQEWIWIPNNASTSSGPILDTATPHLFRNECSRSFLLVPTWIGISDRQPLLMFLFSLFASASAASVMTSFPSLSFIEFHLDIHWFELFSMISGLGMGNFLLHTPSPFATKHKFINTVSVMYVPLTYFTSYPLLSLK